MQKIQEQEICKHCGIDLKNMTIKSQLNHTRLCQQKQLYNKKKAINDLKSQKRQKADAYNQYMQKGTGKRYIDYSSQIFLNRNIQKKYGNSQVKNGNQKQRSINKGQKQKNKKQAQSQNFSMINIIKGQSNLEEMPKWSLLDDLKLKDCMKQLGIYSNQFNNKDMIEMLTMI